MVQITITIVANSTKKPFKIGHVPKRPYSSAKRNMNSLAIFFPITAYKIDHKVIITLYVLNFITTL